VETARASEGPFELGKKERTDEKRWGVGELRLALGGGGVVEAEEFCDEEEGVHGADGLAWGFSMRGPGLSSLFSMYVLSFYVDICTGTSATRAERHAATA